MTKAQRMLLTMWHQLNKACILGPKTCVVSNVNNLGSDCHANETLVDANPTHNLSNSYGTFNNAIQTMLAQILSLMTNHDSVLAIWKVFAQQGFK
jgi:hypothetical protein